MKLADCPIRATLDVLSGKWKPMILFYLKSGKRRYGRLRAYLPEPSEKVLIEQLRQLARDGIIERHVHPATPPQVEYVLTEYGKTLLPLLQLMADWGAKHRKTFTQSINEADLAVR